MKKLLLYSYITILVAFEFHVAFSISRVVYGEPGRLDSFDPYTIHEASGYRLSDLIFDSLVKVGHGGKFEPCLAESWAISHDKSNVTFKLRRNVEWHNTKSSKRINYFTADDVIKTIDLITHIKSEIPNKSRFLSIKKAKKINKFQVKIYFNRVHINPLKNMTFKILPKHRLQSNQYIKKSYEFSKNPIGTGPYKFIEASEQGEIFLEANNKYFHDVPSIDHLILKTYSDANIMGQSLMFNSLDFVTYVSPRDLAEINGDNNLITVPYDALSFSFVAMNNANRHLKNKNFRNALSMIINRKEMLDAFYSGEGHLISGPFPPTSWAYNMDVANIKNDKEKAKKILTSNGYRYKNKKLIDSEGNVVEFTFTVPVVGESEMIKRISLAYQGYLEEMGIKINLQFMDWVIWKKKILRDHDYDLTIASWSFDDSSNIKSLFHSSATNPWGNNFVQFKDSEVDSLLTEAEVTNDFDKKRAIYHKLHAILADHSPYTFLWTLKHHAAHHKRIYNVRIEPFSFFKYISDWKIEDNS